MIGCVTRVEVGLDGALAVLEGVRTEASQRNVAMAAGVCDLGGHTVAAVRMDGAQLAAFTLAADKAFTAVSFGQPSEAWAQSTRPEGGDWGLATAAGGRIVVFAGGLPLLRNGTLVGAIGVSGAAARVDRACAEAGIRAGGFDAVPDGP